MSYFKLLAIALIVTGQNPFQTLGTNTPRVWSWGQENKIFSCLMVFFLSNMLETQFLSTGAFEITLNGVWSCFSGQRDCRLWLNEGLHCKQLAVGVDWMFLPPHTLPLASDTLLQTPDSISTGQSAICIHRVKIIHELDTLNFIFQMLKLEIHEQI
ncbi:hypothetical protein QTP70_016816 [Hemibagrus guttatus]|uniref:Selenoprotein T n=1 Tax=Hemibagrus guttatus TaxID=175788 RepID=A0AAE0V5D4_9TELE|nr:hypothetical protein QTP70_016816 [Hemibagrus guttatus]KAK3565060.1 hypothetical protein QTP86_032485 [Hemibagrus guttatus]